jgi:hypothetical protein
MVKLTEMDDSVTLQQQLMTEAGPVILINQFKVKPEESEQLIAAWTKDALFLKQQPGFYLSAVASRYCGKRCLHQRRRLAVSCRLPPGVQPAGIS